jgi:hypothetical protein
VTGRTDWLGNQTQYRLIFIQDDDVQYRLNGWREEPVERPHVPSFGEIKDWF